MIDTLFLFSQQFQRQRGPVMKIEDLVPILVTAFMAILVACAFALVYVNRASSEVVGAAVPVAFALFRRWPLSSRLASLPQFGGYFRSSFLVGMWIDIQSAYLIGHSIPILWESSMRRFTLIPSYSKTHDSEISEAVLSFTITCKRPSSIGSR